VPKLLPDARTADSPAAPSAPSATPATFTVAAANPPAAPATSNTGPSIKTPLHAEPRPPLWGRVNPPPQPKPIEQKTKTLAQPLKPPEARSPSPTKVPDKPFMPAKPAVVSKPSPPPAARKDERVFLGIDLGSVGCRVCAIDDRGEILASSHAPIAAAYKRGVEISQDPQLWWQTLSDCLVELFKAIPPGRVRRIAVDATSGTLLLCDRDGTPTTDAILYNDARAVAQAERIGAYAVRRSGVHGVSSALAKLLWFHDNHLEKNAAFAAHQADWIVGKLTGQWGHSDHNNCLKLGYNSEAMRWPEWLAALDINMDLLPTVHPSGERIAPVSAEIARTYGLPIQCEVVAGTTDGVAAFLAAGGHRPGHAVTSLGSSLVLKLLSDKPVFSPEHGVYSHRLGRYWLAGGASNSGGVVLLQYFEVEQMEEMTPLLDAEHFTGLEYYPLLDIGERFPHNDPKKTGVLEPLPSNSVTFFQAMLEGIARIEAQGYELLRNLGAPAVTELRTTGGGSHNPAWQRLRERILAVPMKKPVSDQAAYGTALLAAGLIDKSLIHESVDKTVSVS
jgi:sugar (pentulose or hexulose) kinase